MAGELFGASIDIKSNVEGVLKQARESASGFRGEVEKAKKQLDQFDKQKVKEKDIKLKNTQAYAAIEGVKKKIEPLSKKAIMLTAKAEKAVDKIKTVKRHLDTIKDNKVINFAAKGAEKVTKALGKAAIVGTTVAFAAFAAAGATAVTQAIDFQSQMQNVGTLLDGDVNAKLQTMGTDLKKVSVDTGVSTADLSGGLYEVVSAFGESAESVKQLEIAAKGAKAGNASTTDSVKLLSAVTKGYGDTSAAAVQKASDLSFLTAKLGQTTFPELASSMGSVIPLASTLKVSQEELFGAMATLTGVTGNTAEVSTQLRAVMQSFLSPSADMAKSLKGMGYASGAAALESEDLGSILKKLKESVNGDEIAFANMFSSVEAKSSVLALTGTQAEQFAEKTKAMGEAAGASQQAFDTQTNSVAAMAGKIKNAGSVMLTSLGEKALPYITTALEKVVDKLPELESAFDSVASNVGPVIEMVGTYLGDLWTNWQPILSQIKTDFTDAFTTIQPCFDSILSNFGSILPYVQPIVTTFSDVIASMLPAVAPIFEGISGVVETVFPVVSRIIQDVGSKISGIFDGIGEHAGGLKQMFDTVGPGISSVISTLWNVASPILDLIINVVGLVASAFEAAFPYIQSVVSTVWDVIKPIFDGIGKGIGFVADGIKKISGAGTKGIATESDKKNNHEGQKFKGSAAESGVDANATGTTFYGGGWTKVGEHGAELMQLPTGTKIKSNSSSENIGNKPNISIQINKMEVRKESDIDAIATELVKKMEEAGDNS